MCSDIFLFFLFLHFKSSIIGTRGTFLDIFLNSQEINSNLLVKYATVIRIFYMKSEIPH